MKKSKIGLGVAVFIVGILLLFYNPIKDALLSYTIDSLSKDSLSRDKIKLNQQKNARYDFEEVGLLDLEDIIYALNHTDDIHIVGRMSIPSVSMNLPIGLGTSTSTLALTAGTMKKDQVMGEKNYCLAGHHLRNDALLFSPLYEAKIGSAIYLTDAKTVYEYRLSHKETIPPTKMSVLEDSEDEVKLTLITCDDGGDTRLWVTGDFVKSIPIEEADSKIIESFNTDKKTIR
ncbi:MAG: class A sortase [Carnobacterium sp.]|nr:class A sortase [Carnobacterium sp.]